MTVRIIQGDCLIELPKLKATGSRFHCCVTDPPYHLTSIVKRFSTAALDDETQTSERSRNRSDGYGRLASGFMGKAWDGGDVAFRPETWRAVYDVLLPGAYLLAFGGTRTSHRLACAIEDAGFEIRDTICWLYGSGFPKSLNVAKTIDKSFGSSGERASRGPEVRRIRPGADQDTDGTWEKLSDRTYQPHDYHPGSPEAEAWNGWGTALKPAFEPIIVARKPLDGTVAANVLKHGCGALNIDACRVEAGDGYTDNCVTQGINTAQTSYEPRQVRRTFAPSKDGRFPANVIHDGSDEVIYDFPQSESTAQPRHNSARPVAAAKGSESEHLSFGFIDSGSAARFFYTAKADSKDRAGSKHPTVKPTDLMRYLVRLVAPPGGTVIDPFAGTGSTLLAADQLGFAAVGIEKEAQYVKDIQEKIVRDAGMFADLTG
jgi:DNA modification methylase